MSIALAVLAVVLIAAAVTSSGGSGTAVGPTSTTSMAVGGSTTTSASPKGASTSSAANTDASGAEFSGCAAIPAPFPIGDRSCTIVAPPNIVTGEHLPVVVVIHGLTETPAIAIANAGWPAAVVKHRFLVVAPAGVLSSWNAGGCCAPAQQAGINDVGFIDKVLDQISARTDVDMNKLFMVGGSNGGMMTYKYLCTGTHRLVAAVSVAGTSVAGCQPARPVSVTQIHGLDDHTVPYRGGASLISAVLGVSFDAVPASMSALATAEGCSPTSIDRTDGAVTTTTWSGCTNDVTVRLVSVAGLDHVWPVAPLYDGTSQILKFFAIP